MTTRLVLVTILGRETLFFDDETCSRRRFDLKNALFWRRASFSSPFWGEKHYFLATRIKLVTILGRAFAKMLYLLKQ
ncbi:hypothetical protein M4A92_06580 [Caldibacillus thermoamylovorans]|uniref:hypothetical protein n=1 Tax=Caldibacillus thermoamylovorans TaxID=35841 RepID=UPI00203D4479|nr:hypothetical protein [Caldibacillus thermoamylovorans]MCM3798323.1 hypothetical protein [Caldibacillus thermoamylovorans]